MGEPSEGGPDPAAARKFVDNLPPDPEAYDQSDLDRIEELLLCDHHGVVHITATLLREAASRSSAAIEPLLPTVVDAIVHTDNLRRPPLVATLEMYDDAVIQRLGPVEQYHQALTDLENSDVYRSKAASALTEFYDRFPGQVRETVPALLDCLSGDSETSTLPQSAGKTLGLIAAEDPAERSRIVNRFEQGLGKPDGPPPGIVDGIERFAIRAPDQATGMVEQLVTIATDSETDGVAGGTERWKVLGSLKSIAEEEPDLVRPYLDELVSFLSDEKNLIRKNSVKTLGHLAEADRSLLESLADNFVQSADDDSAEVRRAVLAALEPLDNEHERAADVAISAHATQLDSGRGYGRTTAISELGRLSDQYPNKVLAQIKTVIDQLDVQAVNVRAGTVSALGQIAAEKPAIAEPLITSDTAGHGIPQHSTPLVAATTDEHRYVRENAMTALGLIGATEAGYLEYALDPIVHDGLDDEEASVETQALRALGRIGEAHPGSIQRHHAAACVERLDHSNEYVRAAAAAALGAIGSNDRAFVNNFPESLVTLLDDYYPEPRIEACQALAKLGVEDAASEIAPLRDAYDEDVRDAAGDALDELGWTGRDEKKQDEITSRGDEETDTETGQHRRPPDSEGVAAENNIPNVDTLAGPPSVSVEYGDIATGEVIGRGGNAIVRSGTIEVDGEQHPIALKEPVTEGTQTSDDIEAFEREARRWDQLSDRDHVVSVVGWDVDPLPWIALEYMDGGSLTIRIEECSVQEALYVCERVSQAVRHDQTGMAHLDLKPANILFRSTGDGVWDVPKVADWGIAQLLNEHSATSSGMTATYAAPEQFDSDTYGTPDSRTDIYQLGVILYELLTGRPPFTGSDVAVMQSVLNDEPVPPSERVDGLPTAIDETVTTALATEPADRFETMERFQARLQSLLTDG